MSVQLVIAEKPSVARSIAGVIGADQKKDGYMEGNGYLVSWCIGHLVFHALGKIDGVQHFHAVAAADKELAHFTDQAALRVLSIRNKKKVSCF